MNELALFAGNGGNGMGGAYRIMKQEIQLKLFKPSVSRCECGTMAMKDDPQCAKCAVNSWKNGNRIKILAGGTNEERRKNAA